MKVQQYRLNGEPVTINSVETTGDLVLLEEWLHDAMVKGPIGVDSETTGLDIYSGDTLRLVQFGDAYTGWVVPIEDRGLIFRAVTGDLLREIPMMVFHNASFDLQVFEQHLGIPMEGMWKRTQDTGILAHLVEPRSAEDNYITYNKGEESEFKRMNPAGPFGRKLEELVLKHISKEAATEVKQLMTKLAKEYKCLKADIYRKVDLDDPQFHLYSGMDPVFAVRLFKILNPLVPQVSRPLISYEHEIAEVCSYAERNAFLVDEPYSKALSARLMGEEKEAAWHAEAFFGILNPNSVAQVSEELIEQFGMHEEKDCPDPRDRNPNCGMPHLTRTKPTKTKPQGSIQVNDELLSTLATELPDVGSVDHLANAIVEAKRTHKWRTSWVDKFLSGMDGAGRAHAHINPLRARTARMSITGIPAQTLPASDWMVRRCFLADPGHRMVSVDYDAQELRVLAALSQDETMMQAFRDGLDLHQITADSAGVARKIGKMANFLKVYGGGVAKLSKGADIPEDVARKVIQGFSKTYPGVTAYSKYLQNLAMEQGYVTTPLGRVLPVDEERPYAALNYMVQSTSRDITCRGVLNLHKSGFTPYLRLVIHDEVLLSLPESQAQWMTEAVSQLMATNFRGVAITASGEIGGTSWGSLYQCNETPDCGHSKGHKGIHEPTGWSQQWR